MKLDERLHALHERISAACNRAERDPAEVMLLPVSKNHSADAVRELTYHGCRVFGESKIQEAKLKISACPGNLEWQLIGHLQSNKCRDAVRLFRMIQSVDRMSIAEEINRHADNAAKDIPVLLEVNIAGEGTKYGFKPTELLNALVPMNDLPRLEIHGLMTLAPWVPEPEKVRPIFQQLRELKEACEQKLGAPLQHLSMGMSGDFEVAIEEGATIVRIGTALFGPRPRTAKPTE
ncbi:MAG: YggS family pyridoxal phosphate-dependent enzyme [Verrucomicrobiota bacterium]|nr:YggS family pyridoxal phosphate-dependent enzyme [Verrucomicrobiota bacterium]